MNARERLSRISHHFLSEDEQRGATDAPLFFVAVPPVGTDEPHPLPLERLARELVRAGSSIAVQDADRAGISLMYPGGLLEEHPDQRRGNGDAGDIRRLLERGRAQRRPDIVLTTELPAAVDAVDFAVALIVVPADVPQMRGAFLRLKELVASRDRAPMVPGVTVYGTQDPTRAECSFNKFAYAADHFMGVTVTSYGWLSRDDGSAAASDRSGESSLRRIVNLLLADWRAWTDHLRGGTVHETADDAQLHHLRDAHEPATETRIADGR